jgi:fermentation-respiration switch protein FrsA (DUF1100 family)
VQKDRFNMQGFKIFKVAAIILTIAAVFYLFWVNHLKEVYQFKEDTLIYSKNRPVSYEIKFKEKNNSFDVYAINFKSRKFLDYNTTLFGLLFVQNSIQKDAKIPGAVFLPAGGGTKESRRGVEEFIASQGYVVLAIDQRGIGQTGGFYLNSKEDYEVFAKGNEPIQHLSVYDVLASFDVLRNLKEIKILDNNKIALVGESMGARYAMIAAAIDKRIKGVLSISSSGFHITENQKGDYVSYLVSIDPDHYVSKISPNYLIMIHDKNDSLIPLSDAEQTFSLALQPKKLYVIEGCNHGYCSKMEEQVKEALKSIFSSAS